MFLFFNQGHVYLLNYIFPLGINEKLSRIKSKTEFVSLALCILAWPHLCRVGWQGSPLGLLLQVPATPCSFSGSGLPCPMYSNATIYRQCWRLESLKCSLNSTMYSRISIFIWSEVCFSFFFFLLLCFTFPLLGFSCLLTPLLFILLPHIWFSLPDSLPELFIIEKSFHRKATKCSGGVSVKCSVLLDRKSRKSLNPDEMF